MLLKKNIEGEKVKKKYANQIIIQVLNSMVDEERLTNDKAELLTSFFDDMVNNGKIRINYYLENYKEYFEELSKEVKK